MAQCGVPTAAWPFACGDVDLNNGLHWDDTTNKFWVEPGISTTATPLAWPYAASIDAANPTGNGLHWDAATCKPWVQPESNTNHTTTGVSGTFSNGAGYLQDYFGPFGTTKAVYWAGANAALGARAFFNVVERNNCFITIANSSSKNRRVTGDMILPQLIHNMNQQLVQCSLIATQWVEIYTTAIGPTGVWSQFGFTLQNFPDYASPTVYTMILGAGYPWTQHGDGLGVNGFPGWVAPSSVAAYLDTGISASYNKSEHMGTMPWDAGSIAPGQSIRVALLLQGVSPFNPLFVSGPLPDVPYLSGYTQLATQPKIIGTLI
jgi:hypothetical protein